MRAVRKAGAALLALLALAPAALPVAAQTQQSGAAPLTLAALLSPQEQFPVPKASRPFLCENAGFLREHLPLSFVADGVCDCCDGTDERVAEGANPFFASSKGGAEQLQQGEGGAGSDSGSNSGWGWGLLSGGGGGGGSGSDGAAAPAADASPCPNTCAALARDFLSAMEQRVDEYAAGVDAKNKRVRGVKVVRARLAKEAKAMQAALAATADAFRAAQAALQQGGGGDDRDSGVATLRRLQHQGNQLQSDLEQTRWLLGQAVPSPHDRRVQRAAGNFGAQNEWLLLAGRCFDYAWPQRRFGAFGEHVDWYLMQLCPLSNATQTAWNAAAPLPPREGSKWREGATVPAASDPTIARTIDADTSDVAVTEQQQQEQQQQAEEEEPQQWSLGWWTGEIVNQQQEDSAAAAAAAAAATLPFIPAAGAAAAGSVRSPTPEPSFLLPLRDGEPCWQVGPRQVDVELRCGRVDEIVSVVEDGKCRYHMVFATPLACQRDHLALLRQQLEEHRRWFQRRHPKPVPPPTLEQLLHDEL